MLQVFRVFLRPHPDVALWAENLRPQLAAMARHVFDNETKDRLTITLYRPCFRRAL